MIKKTMVLWRKGDRAVKLQGWRYCNGSHIFVPKDGRFECSRNGEFTEFDDVEQAILWVNRIDAPLWVFKHILDNCNNGLLYDVFGIFQCECCHKWYSADKRSPFVNRYVCRGCHRDKK